MYLSHGALSILFQYIQSNCVNGLNGLQYLHVIDSHLDVSRFILNFYFFYFLFRRERLINVNSSAHLTHFGRISFFILFSIIILVLFLCFVLVWTMTIWWMLKYTRWQLHSYLHNDKKEASGCGTINIKWTFQQHTDCICLAYHNVNIRNSIIRARSSCSYNRRLHKVRHIFKHMLAHAQETSREQ